MMDLLKKFNTKLCEIKSKLSKLNPNSQTINSSQQTVNSSQQNIHVYHHHDHWGYHPPIFVNQHNVSVSNDDEDKASPVLGLFIGSVVALSGTYLLATDENIQFRYLDIDSDISELKALTTGINNYELSAKVIEMEQCYFDWKEKICKRTFSQTLSKGTGTFSGLAFATGIFAGFPVAVTAGFIGMVMSGCYYTWNYYSCSSRFSEDLSLENFIVSLRNTNTISELLITQTSYPLGTQPYFVNPTVPFY